MLVLTPELGVSDGGQLILNHTNASLISKRDRVCRVPELQAPQ